MLVTVRIYLRTPFPSLPSIPFVAVYFQALSKYSVTPLVFKAIQSNSLCFQHAFVT